MGDTTTASGAISFAVGGNTTASGDYSTAMGESTTASGLMSTAIGDKTTAQAYGSVVIGRFNVINGTTNNWVATEPVFVIGNGTGTGVDASNALTVLKNGKVGIITDSPTAELDVDGNARFRAIASGAYSAAVNQTSDGTLTTATSDRRLKENIETIEDATAKVVQLRGVTFNWKDKSHASRRIGMIAQEVKEVVPELVFQNSFDGYYGINYAETTALLVEATKELSDRVETLETENTGLRSLVEQMEARLSALEGN
jgi:hypothetical protein